MYFCLWGENGSRCILGKKGNFWREYSSVCARDANDARDNDTNDAKELSYSRCWSRIEA